MSVETRTIFRSYHNSKKKITYIHIVIKIESIDGSFSTSMFMGTSEVERGKKKGFESSVGNYSNYLEILYFSSLVDCS